MRHRYEYYKKNRSIKTEQDILRLIKMFPGISFTEIQKTTTYNSGSLYQLINKIHDKIIVVKDKTRGKKRANNSKNIKTMYFHIDMKHKLDLLL